MAKGLSWSCVESIDGLMTLMTKWTLLYHYSVQYGMVSTAGVRG